MSRSPGSLSKPRRPSGPRCRGGASSLLRLTHNTAPGRFSGAGLAGWAREAHRLLASSVHAGGAMITPLLPSPGVAPRINCAR
jgi:hypothetical protein